MISPYSYPGLSYIFTKRKRVAIQVAGAEEIIQIVCSYFNEDVDVIKSKSRNREIVVPRQLCMLLICENTNLPLTKIGKLFNRDHTTVIHSARTMRNLIHVNCNELDEHYLRLNQLISKSSKHKEVA